MTTTNTRQQELETLEQRSREVCGTCKGEGIVNIIAYTPKYNQPCTDCSGTGRKWPGFSRECPCPKLVDLFSHHGLSYFEYGHQGGCGPCLKVIKHDLENCECQGSGRVRVSVAEAVLWGISWAKEYLGAGACVSFLNGICEFVNAKQGFVLDGTGESDALALFATMKEVE